jgi:DNA polymerase III delta prime subunit
MENINFTAMLGREKIVDLIKTQLRNFQANKTCLTFKRGIYVYGAPGSGKTELVLRLLKELNYDVVKYDAGDIRNKSIIDAITNHTMADMNVVSLFKKQAKPIAIVMDEIDGMNNGDKGGINSLIRIIRPKKTKKQKTEEITFNPIICISSYHVDKKIKELMKVCDSFEIPSPSVNQMESLMQQLMPNLEPLLVSNVLTYLQGDLRKLANLYRLYTTHYNMLKQDIIQDIFKPKSYHEDTKDILKKLLGQQFEFGEHLTTMNETDRTIVGLLWHENIVDALADKPRKKALPLYCGILDNICYADYIDRITFQKQIWQFNEMSSLMKTFHTNKMYHEYLGDETKNKFCPAEIRFTKVLTKYSTEYNNSLFIQEMCQKLGLDMKDTFSYFLNLRQNCGDEEILRTFEQYEISKLDLNRIYRYLDKYTDKNCGVGGDDGLVDIDEQQLLSVGGSGNDDLALQDGL